MEQPLNPIDEHANNSQELEPLQSRVTGRKRSHEGKDASTYGSLPRKRNSVTSESGVLSEPAATDEELATLSGKYWSEA